MADELPISLSFLGGSLSSCIAEFVTFPMDQLKTKMQLGGTQGSVKYSGPLDAIRVNYSKSGIKGFYWGIIPAFFRQFQYSGVRIAIYDKAKAALGIDASSAGVFQRFLLGALSGGFSSFLCTPLDVCKIRIINDEAQLKYSGLLDCLKKIYTNEGFVQGFYRGSSPNIYRAVVVNSAELGTYDNSKKLFMDWFGFEESSVWLRFFASITAGFFASVASSPIDVVKTRYMNSTRANPNEVKGNEMRFTGPLDCFKKIVKNEGFLALYNGFWFLWMRIGPWCTVMFLTWEAYKDYVGKEYKIYKARQALRE
jgi:hypothetical protein